MKANLPTSLLCGLFLALGDLLGPGSGQLALAQHPLGPVTVKVASGRSFTAELDSRTDESRLWLRRNLGSGFLLRPIDWDRVVQVQLAGESYSGEDFYQVVSALREVLSSQSQESAAPSQIVLDRSDGHSGPQSAAATKATGGGHKSLPVRSLAIDVRLANWDGDVEVDGLALDLCPLDAQGAVIAVRGMVEVDLIGERTGTTKGQQPFVRLGHWSRWLSPKEFGPRGARYELPFHSVHPEFDLRWAAYGAVHVRLSVPGEGVFEATDSMVRIRPYSAVRDWLQLSTGRRFLDLERTGEGRR